MMLYSHVSKIVMADLQCHKLSYKYGQKLPGHVILFNHCTIFYKSSDA